MEETTNNTGRRSRMRVWLLVLLWTAAALITLLAAAYFGGVYYFRDRFPFHTSYRGCDVSRLHTDAIAEIDGAAARERTFTVTGRGGTQRVYNLVQWLGYTETGAEPADGWIPSPWRWPESLFTETALPADIEQSYDETMLEPLMQDVATLHDDELVMPENAYLYRLDDHYRIQPETEGNAFRPNALRQAVRDAVPPLIASRDADTVLDLDSLDLYREPYIRGRQDDLMIRCSNYNAIRVQTLTIDLTGATRELTPDDILAFYDTDEDGRIAQLNDDRLYEYVSGLKETYDTYERETPFVNAYGDTVTVGTWRDTYGFKMDLDATLARLRDAILSHRTCTIRPVWIHEARARAENGSDLGDTYIEISIANQHLWAYQNGECIVSTDVVTGNAGNHDSPRGEFYIMYMQRDATLVGDDYESFVNFWMPITASGVGLHDASWRGSYGGSIYRGNGSHGCINMPYWAASDVYWSFSSGTPVVIW